MAVFWGEPVNEVYRGWEMDYFYGQLKRKWELK